jgi:hypothetical protein
MTENSHIVIIPDSEGCGQGSSTETLRDTAEKMPVPAVLMNVPTLHTCCLCWRHADFHYEHPLIETIHLCKLCQRQLTPFDFLCLLRRDMPRDSYKHAQIWIARHQEASQGEKGRVA